eukprot:GGOE01013304.1.p1 GENE.GGOE01013304.1~~GGOE01013304.1.p1  ORF type:complete len:390 (-),score=75.78 GGOE01013304.1:273-1442(-)
MSVKPLALEFTLVNSPNDSTELFMDTANTITTVGDAISWIKTKLALHSWTCILLYAGNFGVKSMENEGEKIIDFFCHTDSIPVRIMPMFHNASKSPTEICDQWDGPSWINVKCFNWTKKVIVIEATHDSTVGGVKCSIQDKEGIPADQQRLIFAGRQLEDHVTLAEYNVPPNAMLLLVLKLRGGGENFCDVSKEDALMTLKWNKTAPKWRIANKGLCIEGFCRNARCEAFNNMVIDNLEFRTFDLVTGKARCPRCKSLVTPEKPGFNNCWYQIIGRKRNSDSIFRTAWKKVANEYTTYNEHQAGTAEWQDLKIFVRPLVEKDALPPSSAPKVPVPADCPICFSGFAANSSAHYTACGHVFHPRCLDRWMQTQFQNGGQPNCPMCRSSLE